MKLNNCVFCDTEADVVHNKETNAYWIKCLHPDCCFSGPACNTIPDAWEAWNQITIKDRNYEYLQCTTKKLVEPEQEKEDER